MKATPKVLVAAFVFPACMQVGGVLAIAQTEQPSGEDSPAKRWREVAERTRGCGNLEQEERMLQSDGITAVSRGVYNSNCSGECTDSTAYQLKNGTGFNGGPSATRYRVMLRGKAGNE